MRSEELRYAKFMARRHHLANMMHPREFKQLVSQASLSLVYYDPNFDFCAPGEALLDRFDSKNCSYQQTQYGAPYSSQYEVRYQHPYPAANTFASHSRQQ
jgi:hypothetical protein